MADKKVKINSKIYDVTDWKTNNYNTHCPIAEEVKATTHNQLIENSMRNIFLGNSYTKCGGEASSRPFYKNQN